MQKINGSVGVVGYGYVAQSIDVQNCGSMKNHAHKALTSRDAKLFIIIYIIVVSNSCTRSHMASYPTNAKYSDTVALTNDETNHKVAFVYSDPSLYLWDVTDIRNVRIY